MKWSGSYLAGGLVNIWPNQLVKNPMDSRRVVKVGKRRSTESRGEVGG